MIEFLLKFKNLEIGVEKLKNSISNDLYNVEGIVPVRIDVQDVIATIKKYKFGEISKEQLVNWVNVIWFTDLYYYKADHENSFASVLCQLETIDEDNVDFPVEDLDKMIASLAKNLEFKI